MNSPDSERASAVQGLIEEGDAFRRLTDGPSPHCVAFDRPGQSHFDVIVIGGGQAGLTVGYHLQKLGLKFLILDASSRIGDAWRKRWDTLRLFTPARYDSLDGLDFPRPPNYFPTKDEMANYLERYAGHFQLPVRNGTRVTRLSRAGQGYRIEAGAELFQAQQVVVAMSTYQGPKVPDFATQLAPDIVQLHSSQYRGLSQLQPGGVLVVGAGNSGAEIAIDTAGRHPTWLSGRDPGEVPFAITSVWGRLLAPFLFRFVFRYILNVNTPIGRKARAKMRRFGGPRIRQRRAELTRAGIEWVPRTSGVRAGLPLLNDGRVVQARNVIWCTGYSPNLSWIDLPIFDEHGEPRQVDGVVESEPGLYFVGRLFVNSLSSTMVHGVGRDALRVARALYARSGAGNEGTGTT